MKEMRRITTKIAGVALATVMAFGGTAVFAADNGDQVYSRNFYAKAERNHILADWNYIPDTATFTVPEDGKYTICMSSDHDADSYKSVEISDSNGRIPVQNSGYWESTSIQDIDLYEGVEYTIEASAKNFMGYTLACDGIVVINVSLELTEKFEEEEEIDGEGVVPYFPEMPEVPRMPGDPDVPVIPEITTEPIAKPDAEVIPVVPGTPEAVTAEDKDDPVTLTTPEQKPAVQTSIQTEVQPSAEPAAQNEAEPVSEETIAAPVFSSLSAEQIRALSVKNFVGHLYIEGLGRYATDKEIGYWADKLMCGSITATQAASQILTSTEFNEHEFDNEKIASILDEVFGTNVKADTLDKLNNGDSLASVIEQLAGSEDWASKCAFYKVNV